MTICYNLMPIERTQGENGSEGLVKHRWRKPAMLQFCVYTGHVRSGPIFNACNHLPFVGTFILI